MRAPVFSRCGVISRGAYPAPVAELTADGGTTVGGALLRMQTAPEPLLMLSPMAPPEYGSGRNLLAYTDDPNRTENRNRREVQPIGIRLLTFSPPNW
ncbi:MAG: hypothetical protein NTZ46_00745 [Verrucomicrobia bacterium]|nr:hypothetical protein [Verrucomicrobiota bacterium]